MTQECCQPDANTLILACASSSNVRQPWNQAAEELPQTVFGKLYCLTGRANANGVIHSDDHPIHRSAGATEREAGKVACVLYPLTGTAGVADPCLIIRPAATSGLEYRAPGHYPALDDHQTYPRNADRRLCALLSADVEGYSRLMGEDELHTIQKLQACQELIAEIVEQFRGRVVDSPGDNVLAEFASAVAAVECAVAIQNELKIRNTELPVNRRMKFRIGINVGDVIKDKGRLYGDGVNIAARIENLAKGGEIFISGTVHDQVERKLPLEYKYLGRKKVKNIFSPLPVYRIITEPQTKQSHWRNLPILRMLVNLFNFASH